MLVINPFRPWQILLICFLLWRPWQANADLCPEVCEASKSQVDQHNFIFEGKEVFCGEEACLVEPTKYKVHELSKSAKKVTFDAKLLKLTGIKMDRDELGLGLWVRMAWHDPRLKLCDCSKAGQGLVIEEEASERRAKMQGNLEEFVWTPDFTISERVHTVRREGKLLDFMVEANKDSSGVNITYTVNLRVAAKCMFNTTDYPYNKNSCKVRIVPYNHGHGASTMFVPRNLTRRNILYKDFDVEVCLLKGGHGKAARNGFRVVLDRRGDGVMRTYEFTMMAFVGLAVLAVALSPLYTDVSFIGEAVLVAFYVDFDLYTKAPPVANAEGGETLLEEVTRIAYTIVLVEAVICISLRFLIRRFQENQHLPWLKKLLHSSWLSFIGIMTSLAIFAHLNYVVEVRLAGQSWDKCEDVGQIEH